MSPNEERSHAESRRLAHIGLLAAALMAVLPSQSPAHTVLLSRGTVTVRRDCVASRIEVNATDFVHYFNLRLNPEGISVSLLRDAVLKHRQHLVEHFIIRNAAGQRLHGECLDVEWTEPVETRITYARLGDVQVTYVLRHPTMTPPHYLTFQQRLGRAYASTPIRLALSVTTESDAAAQFIQLTNGGNVETLDFARPDPATGEPMRAASAGEPAMPTRVPRPDRFRAVHARVDIEDGSVVCETSVPLVLLETWLPLRRARGDFIEPEEMTAAGERLRTFFAGHNPIHLNGRPAAPCAVRLSFLGPDASSMDVPEAARLGTWSARVGVRLQYEAEGPVSQVELVWDLFNNAVQNATVTMVSGDSRYETIVSSYSPSVAWPQGDPPAAIR